MTAILSRRTVLIAGTATLLVTRVSAEAGDHIAAVRVFAGEADIRPGRVRVDLPPLVENGNAAPLTVEVESPMSEADFVRRIAVFNEKNPQPNVITVQLGARAGRALVSTRIRLATSQRITAVAEMSDGTFWSGGADVIVTLAACAEG